MIVCTGEIRHPSVTILTAQVGKGKGGLLISNTTIA
jgi:hypothetical protein